MSVSAGTLERELAAALPPAILTALENEHVNEIMANGDGRLWVEHAQTGMLEVEVAAQESVRGRAIKEALTVIATLHDRQLDATHPVLECHIPLFGSRLEGVLPPVAVDGPCLSIRKHSPTVLPWDAFRTIGTRHREASDAGTASLREAVERALREGRTILVAGPTSSGKTTFLNTLTHLAVERHPAARWLVLENTQELKVIAPNTVRLSEISEPGLRVSLRDLTSICMRMRPTFICIGEVRGAEALDLLKAWLSGHPGFSTIHADSVPDALTRLEQLNQEAGSGAQRDLIARSVDLVIHMEKRLEGERSIRGFTAAAWLRNQLGPNGEYQWIPVSTTEG